MLSIVIRIAVLIYSILYSVIGICSDAVYTDIYHEITFTTQSNYAYYDNVKLSGVNLDENNIFSIYHSSLKDVDDLSISYINSKGKRKNLNKDQIEKGDLYSSSFINDGKLINFKLPSTLNFEYSYTLKVRESLLFVSLDLTPKKNVQSISYSISIPDNLTLSFKLPPEYEKYGELKIDSTEIEDGIMYSFIFKLDETVSKNKSKDHNLKKGIRPTYLNEIRVLAYPKNYKGGAFAYYNDWVFQRISQLPELKPELTQQIDEIIPKGASDSDKTRILFDWVKDEISYIDIEGGINSFIPRDANLICIRQKGDCKDMSNLLYQSLKYVGVDAYLAVSATLAHRFDFDFPCFASGNHMICVAKIKGEIICLDATEDLCRYPNPSRQIQGRNIFLHDDKVGELYRVPVLDASKNSSLVIFEMNLINGSIDGTYSIFRNEMSGFILKEIYQSYSDINFEKYVKHWFENNLEKIEPLSIEIINNDSSIEIYGDIKCAKSIVNKIGDKTYIQLDFIPFPHNNSIVIDTNQRLVTYYASKVRFEGRLHFEEEVFLKDNNEVIFDSDAFKYTFQIQQIDQKTILVSYDYLLNSVEITTEHDIALYNKLNEEIISSLNNRIIIEN